MSAKCPTISTSQDNRSGTLIGGTSVCGVEVRLGHDLVDAYLRFVAARCRSNMVLAAGFDLKVFFTFVPIDPVKVTPTENKAMIQPNFNYREAGQQTGDTASWINQRSPVAF